MTKRTKSHPHQPKQSQRYQPNQSQHDEASRAAERVMQNSRQWVASLDRSAITSFSVTGDILASAHALSSLYYAWQGGTPMLAVDNSMNIDITSIFSSKLHALSSRERNLPLITGRPGAGFAPFIRMFQSMHVSKRTPGDTEVFYWWLQGEDDSMMRDYALARMSDDDEIRTDINHLTQVVDNPNYRSFYLADIWDDDFIAHCIAADIDLAMAVGLMRDG